MIDIPTFLMTARHSTAIIRVTIPHDRIRAVMGPSYRELIDTLCGQGIVPAGPWFTRHLRMDPQTFDFEIGVPVNSPVVAMGRVTNSHLPAAMVARTIYHDDYEGLASAWRAFDAWIAAEGRVARPFLWETYLTDPNVDRDPATWRTELTRPLAT
jgi:effector-binding domain-containing protein